MGKLTFVTTLALLVTGALGGMALRYNVHISPRVQPAIIVYHDSSVAPNEKPGQSKSERYWTLAIGSDGSTMLANAVPDGSGRISGPRAIEFRDRYVVVEPLTRSVTTYKPTRPIIVATQDCKGSRASSILGHTMELVGEHLSNKKSLAFTGRERWLALDLNCVALQERVDTVDSTGKPIQVLREAVQVRTVEPPNDYFEIPAEYQERGPAEVDMEMRTEFAGKHVFGSTAAADTVQKAYEKNRLK